MKKRMAGLRGSAATLMALTRSAADHATCVKAPSARLPVAQYRCHHRNRHQHGFFFAAVIGGMLATQPGYAPPHAARRSRSGRMPIACAGLVRTMQKEAALTWIATGAGIRARER